MNCGASPAEGRLKQTMSAPAEGRLKRTMCACNIDELRCVICLHTAERTSWRGVGILTLFVVLGVYVKP